MAAPNETEAEGLWRGLLKSERGLHEAKYRRVSGEFGACRNRGIPVVVAKGRIARSRAKGGRNEPETGAVVDTRARTLEETEASLTDAEIQQIAASVAVQGDPGRTARRFFSPARTRLRHLPRDRRRRRKKWGRT